MPLTHTRIAIKAGQLIIILQDRDAATDEQWAALLTDVKAARAALMGEIGQVFGLVISDGGAPNARQRSALATTLDGQSMRAGVLSDSTLVRGAVTAMAWFNQGIRSFSPNEANKLFEYMSFSQQEIPLIRRAIGEIYKHVRVTTLVNVPSLLHGS
jgi:hypothetical protein